MIMKNFRLSHNYKDFDRIENPFTMSVYNTSTILKGKITRKYKFSNNANTRSKQRLQIQFAKQLYMSEIKTNI